MTIEVEGLKLRISGDAVRLATDDAEADVTATPFSVARRDGMWMWRCCDCDKCGQAVSAGVMGAEMASHVVQAHLSRSGS